MAMCVEIRIKVAIGIKGSDVTISGLSLTGS